MGCVAQSVAWIFYVVSVRLLKFPCFLAGRKKFTLVAHDWGAVICWDFLSQHMDMLDKYIFMDAPSRGVAHKLMMSTKEQFKMSW